MSRPTFRTLRRPHAMRQVECMTCMDASMWTPFSGVLADWRRGHVCGGGR